MLTPSDDVIARVASSIAGGRDPAGAMWEVSPVGPVENMTTRSLDRVAGTLADGTPWSVIAKTLHPASDSPIWQFIPAAFRDQVIEDLNWLDEPRVYESGLRDALPAPLRMPEVFAVDRSESTVTIWMEDVADSAPWDLARFGRTALALGRLVGRVPGTTAVSEFGMGRRPMSRLFFGKISNFDLLVQREEEFWSDPVLSSVVDDRHRDDLYRLAASMPELLERLERLPHAMAHGDASTGNLLQPGFDEIVAIDWSYGCVAAVGSDLAQLIASGSELIDGGIDALGELAEVVTREFVAGARHEGTEIDPADLDRAWTTTLAVRAVFSALMLERPADCDDETHVARLTRRAALGRFGVDRAAVLDGAT